MSMKRLCIFGEVLFDTFPDGHSVLGGAPFNVAWHAQAFGLSPCFISRVGKDPAGEAVIGAMRDWGMDLSGMQHDPEHPTGKVEVSFGPDKEPAYDIVADCAYDFIDKRVLPEPGACDVLYHGTLALRNRVSRQAVGELKIHCPGGSFVDVNLRPPWWDADVIAESLSGARWVKLNTHELSLLGPEAAGGENALQSFVRQYDPELLVVTSGEEGAVAVADGVESARAAPEMQHAVVDTVGAGDAFSSVILLGLLKSWPLQQTMERAQAFASAIVGVRGATVRDLSFYEPFKNQWELQ